MHNLTKALFIISCIFLLCACERPYTQVAAQTCDLNLQITIHQGMNAGRNISGHVDFGSGTWSSFKLDFVEDNSQSHPSSFSFSGQAIHFILDTEEGSIFAAGIMESNLATCSGTGGGTLSGPLVGDLGDWRGEWVATVLPTPSAQPSTSSQKPISPILFFIYSPFIILGLVFAIFLFRVFAPYKLIALFKGTPSSKQQASSSALRRTNQRTRSDAEKDEQFITEYLATYTADDKLFDLSFQIEQSSQYIGECGVTVAKVLDEKSNQAAALEIWLFDPRNLQTISKILASNFCFSQANLRSELEKTGQVTLAQAGDTITLETKGIKAKTKILQMEYNSSSPNPQSIFKKVMIQIRIYANAEQDHTTYNK